MIMLIVLTQCSLYPCISLKSWHFLPVGLFIPMYFFNSLAVQECVGHDTYKLCYKTRAVSASEVINTTIIFSRPLGSSRGLLWIHHGRDHRTISMLFRWSEIHENELNWTKIDLNYRELLKSTWVVGFKNGNEMFRAKQSWRTAAL